MHIAFIGSIRKPTIKSTIGGAQVWAEEFLREGVKRGHTFDLYAVNGSLNIPGKVDLKVILKESGDEALNNSFFINSKNQLRDLDVLNAKAYAHALLEIKRLEDEYELIIDSSGRPFMGINWDNFVKPLLVIGHNPVDKQYVKIYNYVNLPQNVFFSFLSKLQFNSCSWISESNKDIVPNGIDISELAFYEKNNGDQLLWMGRFDLDQPKGMEESITVAERLNMSLDIYTFLEKESEDYYKNTVLPRIVDNTKITVTLPPQPSKVDIFLKSKVMLFPAMTDEPAPLVVLECMATGTPIIVFARGSLPEVIKDGETGFIVNPSDDDIRGDFIIKKTGIEGLCEAVERIYAMPEEEYRAMRKRAREHVEQNFTIEKMVDRYEDLFKKILNKE